MGMRFDWQFGPANVYSDENFTDAINQIHWWCTLYGDDGSTYKMSDAVQLGSPNIENFVPFKNVTQDMVISWVYNSIDPIAIQNDLIAESTSSSQSVKQFNY